MAHRFGMTALACALAAPWAASAADGEGGFWPRFHGPNHDNTSVETGLLRAWPEGGPPLAWRFGECGEGYAGVSVAGGRIFTAGDFGAAEYVLCLDLGGTLLWKTANGRSWRGSTPGARTSPTASEGAVFHMNPTGRLAAFEAATGKELWAVDLREEFGASPGAWGFSENLAVDGDLVLCAPGGARGRIVALDKKTGATRWANTALDDSAAYCSPIVVTHAGVRQYITLMRKALVGIDVRSGKLLWSHPHQAPYAMNITTPRYKDGCVFVASGHNTGGRLVRIGAAGAAEVWFNNDIDNCHNGVAIIGGYMYGSGCRLHHDGLQCVEVATGKTMPALPALGKVSLTCADGMLVCLNQQRVVSLVRPDPEGSAIVSSFTLPAASKDDTLAHPVVCGGRLYLRHAANLYAYDIRAAAAAERR